MADDAISTAPPSRAVTPSDNDLASLTSSMEPLQSIKQLWVWNYLSDVDETYVECNVMNHGGQSCKKRLKKDQTGNSPSFQSPLELCNPNILNILVRRTAITSYLAEVFLFHQEHLQSTIFLQTHKVSFNTDVWTSPNVTAFLAVTAHFLDANWNLTSVLLGLNTIEGKQVIQ
ncbi:hypothetical protein O181_107300, partial [Austropuccinia psidii MF-1]|nr:hypothetical protein [Austropuccinia psidii MF-1]